MMRNRLAWIAVVLASGAAVAMACNFDDENPGSPGSSGTVKNPDGSVASSSGTSGTSGTSGALCAKVGGQAAVADVASATIAALEADCHVGAHITLLNPNARAHFEECFAIQLGEFLGCSGVTYAGSKDSKGQNCRGMAQAHGNMTLRDADFKVFVNTAAGVLKTKGFTDDDVAGIVGPMNGTYGAVVKVQDPKYNSKCTCTGPEGDACRVPVVVDAGTDATTTTDAPSDAPTEGG